VKRAECDGARCLCEDEHDGTTTTDDDSNGEGGCINDDASEGERQSDNDHDHSNTKCGGGDVETSGRRSNFNGGGCDDFGGCSGHNSAGRRRCGLDLGHGSLDDVNVGDGGRRHQRRCRHLGAEEVSGKRSIDVGVNGAGEGSGGFGADERVELGGSMWRLSVWKCCWLCKLLLLAECALGAAGRRPPAPRGGRSPTRRKFVSSEMKCLMNAFTSFCLITGPSWMFLWCLSMSYTPR
jgi:hypothetical protein